MPNTHKFYDRYRVFRGGARREKNASYVRAAYRYGDSPTLRVDYIGFRCAQRGCRQQILKVTP